MNDHAIEQEIQAKGLTAPRITPDDIEAAIEEEVYFTGFQGAIGAVGEKFAHLYAPKELHILTFCVLILKNGFMVTGESVCASPENFDLDIGQRIARQNAVQKIWPLMGYALKDQLYNKEAQ